MNPKLVTLACAAAFAAATPASANDITATFDTWAGWTFADGNTPSIVDDENHPAIGGEARFQLPFGTDHNLSLGITGDASFLSGNQWDDNYGGQFLVDGHWNIHDSERGLIGIAVGAGRAYAGEDEGAQVYLGAVEGQLYHQDWTFYGQAGYFTTDDETSNDSITDAWYGRGVARYFFDDASFFEVDGTYGQGDVDPGGTSVDGDPFWIARAQYERNLNNSNASWFIRYQAAYVENKGDNTDVTDHTVSVGFRLRFGHGNSRSIDTSGANLDLPDVARIIGYTIESVD